VPALYAAESDPIRRLDAGPLAAGGHEDVFTLPRRGPALVNVGSIGQPRDGDPRAAYGLLDTESATLRLRRVPYDIAAAQARILEAELPPYLALRLARGQ
jgi:diadenosine tetraphosphatase ApaH/serine/threonine PP2A family protein phosphatase